MAAALQNSLSSKKRRFQPPITSYFAASTPETEQNRELSHHCYAAPTNTPTPALPANILSSLLGVGARVRKSVPEGYKTEQKKLTAYTIPAASKREVGEQSVTSQQSTMTTVYAELEPFCGMHKVGNYAVQTFPRPDEQYRDMDKTAEDLETTSIPSSSQGSNTSSSSSSSSFSSLSYTNSNSNKRAYDSDVEEDYDSSTAAYHPVRGGFVSGDIWQDTAATRFYSSVYTSAPSSAIPRRTILSPKLSQHRRHIATPPTSTSGNLWKAGPEQENEDPLAFAGGGEPSSADMMDLDDFGEASFLRRREEVDDDYL